MEVGVRTPQAIEDYQTPGGRSVGVRFQTPGRRVGFATLNLRGPGVILEKRKFNQNGRGTGSSRVWHFLK